MHQHKIIINNNIELFSFKKNNNNFHWMAMIQSSYVYQRHWLFYYSDLQLLVDQAPPSSSPAPTDSRNSQLMRVKSVIKKQLTTLR